MNRPPEGLAERLDRTARERDALPQPVEGAIGTVVTQMPVDIEQLLTVSLGHYMPVPDFIEQGKNALYFISVEYLAKRKVHPTVKKPLIN